MKRVDSQTRHVILLVIFHILAVLFHLLLNLLSKLSFLLNRQVKLLENSSQGLQNLDNLVLQRPHPVWLPSQIHQLQSLKDDFE